MIVVARKAVASQEVLQKLAGSADKWQALDILVLARSFTYYHQRCFAAAPVDYNIGASCS